MPLGHLKGGSFAAWAVGIMLVLACVCSVNTAVDWAMMLFYFFNFFYFFAQNESAHWLCNTFKWFIELLISKNSEQLDHSCCLRPARRLQKDGRLREKLLLVFLFICKNWTGNIKWIKRAFVSSYGDQLQFHELVLMFFTVACCRTEHIGI